ncbi:MAG TPA: isoaspartyl peptidase/L-asparaginase [Rhodanobacteraceae bacterium]|nr:isoaspartyl peptidase/L-asparaginase [Rhodanobacteraceae bacterium]
MDAHDNAPVLLIHGGAGVIRKDTDESEQAIRTALADALRAGFAKLQAGGSALDAVGAAVVELEDAPHFNAGHGAVFTHDGGNELDAAIMEGAGLRAGAIAGVQRVRNPILLARAVMEHSPHVMLAGTGAESFAQGQGIALVEPDYFRTGHRWRQLQEALAKEATGKDSTDYFGTVGAVARDARGRLAAATSTGGMTNKRWNRIGDSPVIGAGTYANAHCAVSGTGRGEFYLRTCAAHAICMRVAQGEPLAGVAEDLINREIPRLGGNGGAIVLGRDGAFALPFNTQGMYRGWIGADGEPHVAIYRDE